MQRKSGPTALANETAVEGPRRLLKNDECRIIWHENDVIGQQQPYGKRQHGNEHNTPQNSPPTQSMTKSHERHSKACPMGAVC